QSKQLRRVDLSLDALSSQGLQQILNFIYTSRLLVSSRSVRDVLNAATLLQMMDIAASCRDLISSQSLRAAVDNLANQDGLSDPNSMTMTPGSQLYREIKQEAELGRAELERVYTREGNSPFSVRVEDGPGESQQHHPASSQSQAKQYYFQQEDRESGGGGGRGLFKLEGGGEQIIVEVNLNNQTLNVSKGSESKAVATYTTATAMFTRSHGDQREEEDKEEDDDDDDDGEVGEVGEEEQRGKEEKMGNSSEEEEEEEEEENNDMNIPAESIMMNRTLAVATTTVSMRQTLGDATLANLHQGRKRKQNPESVGQMVRLEEKQQFHCKKCPRVFNNRWYLEKHMNVTHNRMQICNKCGKRFLLESELLLHHQTNCEKSIQCATCGKAFKKLWSLHEHNKIVHGYAEKKFCCEICEKKFYTMAHVRKHMV
ncbi:hypothetical protein J4Q44_G00392550, partial [Coregonus suidteri]